MKKAVISVLLTGLILAGCGSSSSSASSSSGAAASPSSTNAAQKSAACPHNPVRFAVEPYDTGPALEKAYGSLAKDIQQKLGCPVQLIISNSYVAEIDAMRGGNLEMGEFGPRGYVLAHKIADAQPIAAFGDKNSQPDTYTAGLWVKKSSSITGLKQLSGKTVALSSTTSASGGLYPISALVRAGFTCTVTTCHGLKVVFSGGHPQSLRRVGMLEQAWQPAGTLSGGQAQRVAIARALTQQASVILADEPVSALDPRAADEILSLLADLAHNDGLAVLAVLHQPELALRHADRVVGMKLGGGIGFLIDNELNVFAFKTVMTYMIVLVIVVLAVERVSTELRRRLV